MAHTYLKLTGVHPLPGLKDRRIRALVLNCFTSGLHSAVFSIYLLIRLQVEKVFGLHAPRNSFRALHRAPKKPRFWTRHVIWMERVKVEQNYWSTYKKKPNEEKTTRAASLGSKAWHSTTRSLCFLSNTWLAILKHIGKVEFDHSFVICYQTLLCYSNQSRGAVFYIYILSCMAPCMLWEELWTTTGGES